MSDSKAGSNQGLKKLPRLLKPEADTFTPKRDTKFGRRHLAKPVQMKHRTPEEEKAYREGQQKVLEAAQKRAAIVGNFEASVPHMSFRQLRGQLRRIIKTEYFLGEPTTPINVAEAICALINLENTKTRENFAGKLSAVLNPTIASGSPRYIP